MLTIIAFLSQDESAAAAVEYGLLLAFIAIVAIVGITHLANALNAVYLSARDALVGH
jgi:Flp pilus assembly pilin Flp